MTCPWAFSVYKDAIGSYIQPSISERTPPASACCWLHFLEINLTVDVPDVHIRHGRQFHWSGSNYGLPNDERESDRLNDQAVAVVVNEGTLGSNYTAPLPQLNSGEGPKDILDVATGTGIWIAREFPQARVVGIDLSKPGLSYRDVPGNASFVVGDVTKQFPFGDASFDVVQMRIAPSIAERTSVYKEIHRVLRPGGVIQLVELSPPVSRKGHRPPSLDKADQAVARGGHVHKKDQNKPLLDRDGRPAYWSIASQIAPAIRNNPSMWTSVEEKQVAVPIGIWANNEIGQEAGRIMQRQTVELYNGFRPNLIDIGGMAEDEIDQIIAELAEDLKDGSKWQLETHYDFVWAMRV
ncbi:Methyltransferase domain, partial [Rhizoctonia solani]